MDLGARTTHLIDELWFAARAYNTAGEMMSRVGRSESESMCPASGQYVQEVLSWCPLLSKYPH